ncbi:MAG: hypothetical protein JSV96_14320 [Candidatus Aminicenantes bacterium]|nr:MAG: hypothetical protein JSV96_14320 [Candidatus Aminicenantes bacterium]
MNMKLKITFVFIITLALGIVFGFMVNRTYSQKRIRNILSSRSPEFFVTFYERILEPDTKQSKMIREILDNHAKRISEIRENFTDEMQSELESMKAEIDPILTPEQKERLKRRFPGRPPRRGRPMKKRDPDKEFSMLKERLHLSKDQVKQIAQIFEESGMPAGKMWGEMRFYGGWRMRGEMRFPIGMMPMIQKQKETEKAIEKILTEEQKESYKQLKKERLEKIKKEIKRFIEMIEE